MVNNTSGLQGLKNLTALQKLGLAASIVLVSVAVALVYFYFEAAVHHSINYLWVIVLNTNTRRWLVVPACFAIGLLFFGLQYFLDPDSETHQSKGLGEAPKPTLVNLAKVLGIGFFSLLAGASLGPEAILVPASLIVGAYIGITLFKKNQLVPQLLGMVGFIALFAAFFDSFIAGLLGMLLVTKQVKIKLDAMLVVVGVVASAITVYVLSFLESSAYVRTPTADWHLGLPGLLTLIFLVIGGGLATYALHYLLGFFERVRAVLAQHPWWVRWLVACTGLSFLYLIGGSLVQFTGNEAIVPMLQQAAQLGVVGLVWLAIVKVAAISWSKTVSYRGGLVFPSLFVASVLVAIAQQVVPSTSFTLGLIAAVAGLLIANQKLKILF